jgi:rRNA maturation protein Nop10
LIFDIETHLKRAKLFRHGKQYVSASSFEDYDTMICWSAKWLGDTEVFGDVQTPLEAVTRDHSRISKSLWNAMSQAQFTISHNGDHFDLPMVRTFFVEGRLGLPGFFRSIDTCQIARQNFKFESNAMDYLCKRLGLNDGKIATSIDLWNGCYEGDKKSLDYMFNYNKMDSVVLEDLYNVLIPYVPNFPNLGIWGDVNEAKCPYCGGNHFHNIGYKFTPNGKFNSYRCECQAIFRSKQNLLSRRLKALQFAT